MLQNVMTRIINNLNLVHLSFLQETYTGNSLQIFLDFEMLNIYKLLK